MVVDRGSGKSSGTPAGAAGENLRPPLPFPPRTPADRRPGELGLLLALAPLVIGILWAGIVFVSRRFDSMR